jgi:hypothetical protein
VDAGMKGFFRRHRRLLIILPLSVPLFDSAASTTFPWERDILLHWHVRMLVEYLFSLSILFLH